MLTAKVEAADTPGPIRSDAEFLAERERRRLAARRELVNEGVIPESSTYVYASVSYDVMGPGRAFYSQGISSYDLTADEFRQVVALVKALRRRVNGPPPAPTPEQEDSP